MFDLNGRLLGVISATLLTEGHAPTPLDEATPVSVVVKSLRILRLMRQAVPTVSPTTETFTPEELYRHMLNSTVLVAAYP